MSDWKGTRVNIEVIEDGHDGHPDIPWYEGTVLLDTDSIADVMDAWDPAKYTIIISPTVQDKLQ